MPASLPQERVVSMESAPYIAPSLDKVFNFIFEILERIHYIMPTRIASVLHPGGLALALEVRKCNFHLRL